MMGDNRDNSTDSREQSPRYGVGYVPYENLVGRAEIIFFSAAVDDPQRLPADQPVDVAVRHPLEPDLQSRALSVPWRRSASSRNSRPASAISFENRDLLKKALTHASVRQASGKRRDNERLEFLGDRVLGLAIAELLSEVYPAASEGDLAQLYNRLVRGGTCAAVARELDLGPFLVLSEAEAGSGGRDKETILADACEALLGAIFLEAGYETAREVVRTLWGARVGASPAEAADAKSLLQEWAQGQGLDLPDYVEVDRQGPDHAPRFTAEVRIKGTQARARRGRQQARGRAGRRHARCWRAKACGSAVPMPERRDRRAETRCGFIAVIGAPNAGKSTLVNALVGAKVAIVSRKVQTTRMPLRGIAIEGASQLVFIDTPGIFAPRRRLDRAMVDAAWGGAGDADMVVLVVDAAKGLDEDVERILDKLAGRQGAAAAGAQQDRPREEGAAAGAGGRAQRARAVRDTFMISALDGDGVADLKAHLARAVPPGPWHYPEDEISDAPLRVLAAEITREKIYDRLHDELPYQATVETTSWQEQKNGVRIEQTIFVERDSQKSIVLGKGGQHDQAALDGGAQGADRDPGEARAPVPVRQGARELGRRSRALPRAGPGVSEGVSAASRSPLARLPG